MSTTTDLTVLKINYLTQAQYDNAKSQGTLEANEIYMTPVSSPGVEDVEVDGVSVVTDGVAEITMPTVPTKVSQLQNDSGYITGYTETDPTVPSWAKASSKPSYTASEVGYGSSNVQSALDDLYTLKVLVISVASFSSLPQTVTNASITADHVCLKAELGTPSAQTGDWTVTTSAGSLTISGSISGSTTATLYLAIKQ